MYTPAPFAEPDRERLLDFVEAESFGLLISADVLGPTVSHLPFLVEHRQERSLLLVAHCARANPHWRALDGASVLVVFSGPHGYVSPRWYTGGPAVPTWNYGAVHLRGRARCFDDPARLGAMAQKLAARHEAGADDPWTVDGLPDAYRDAMLAAIVGIEIAVDSVEGKMKLSQNRPTADRAAVAAALTRSNRGGDRDLAELMNAYFRNSGSDPCS